MIPRTKPSGTAIVERYIGVDVADDGMLVVAERQDGRCAGTLRFPAGNDGLSTLRSHIAGQGAHPHVCVRACGAAALTVALGLLVIPGIEVTLIAPHAIESKRVGAAPAILNADERADRLARRAERFF